jgi:hypothetical protein
MSYLAVINTIIGNYFMIKNRLIKAKTNKFYTVLALINAKF